MLDKSFIEKIAQLSVPVQFEIEGREYTSKGLVPVQPPRPSALAVSTLASLVKYVQDNPDRVQEVIICIDGPRQVSVFSPFDETWKSRETYLIAKDDTPQFPFNAWVSVEEFIIKAQVHFDDDEARQALLKVVGNLTDGIAKTHVDDGITQQVTVKAGVARIENVDLPRIIQLKVRRTFYEIGSIPGNFVLRMRSQNNSPACALFETAERVWEQEAVTRIYEYIQKAEYPIKVTVIA